MVIAKHLLLIEDDSVLGPLLLRVLEGAGYTVRLTDNGVDGITLLDEAVFDLVITAINMPHGDGYSVLRAIVARGHTPPIIFMTGGVDVFDVQAAFDAGVSDCLFKPFPMAAFLASVATYC